MRAKELISFAALKAYDTMPAAGALQRSTFGIPAVVKEC